jgi:hypothetical protein
VKTLPYTGREIQTVSTLANGNASILIIPQLGQGSFVGVSAVTTAGIVTTDANVLATTFGIVADVSGYRFVTAGVRVRNIAPHLTASGMVHIRSWAAATGSDFSTFDGTSFSASQCRDVSLVDTHEECLLFERTTQLNSEFFTLTAGPTVAAWSKSGLNPISITLMGGPATTACLSIEVIYHIEYIFSDGASMGFAATNPPVFNPLLTQAANTVTSTFSNFAFKSAEMAGDYIRQHALSALRGVLSRDPRMRPLLALTG